jgi:ankyrin repeat protein
MSLRTKLSALLPSNICAAVKDGDLEKVKALLKPNPDLVFNVDDAGWTSLHYAAHWGNKDVAELLLANKAEVNALDNAGLRPLHCAAAQGYVSVTKALLADKAEVNAQDEDGFTPLHFVAAEGLKDLVELLLSSKAAVNAKDNEGKTPLRWAFWPKARPTLRNCCVSGAATNDVVSQRPLPPLRHKPRIRHTATVKVDFNGQSLHSKQSCS